jgi:hypothetical protein
MLEVLAMLIVLLPLIVLALILEGISPAQHIPMTYDEEMKWLMNEHGLTWEEANEFASISNFRK